MGAGIGAGLGMAMAERMARSGPWGQAPVPAQPTASAPPPPPPPGGRVWHLAVDGASSGPFTQEELAAKAVAGEVGPDTWLWTPGGPDWRRGRDVGELADLFSAPPPPPAG
jgi:hypothetical protein